MAFGLTRMVTDAGLLSHLLHPAEDLLLVFDAASPLVNNANNEGAELLLARADPQPEALTLF